MFDQNDLFKIFILQLINDPPNGGILIIPVNFWSSSRASDVSLRKTFLELFCIIRVNIFEEAVFEDGAVCAIEFVNAAPIVNIHFNFYPGGDERVFVFDKSTNYTIGWDIISLSKQPSLFKTTRLLNGATPPNTYITLKTLDNISLYWSDKPYYGKNTSRTFASLTIEPPIDEARQRLLIEQFNEFVSLNRAKYKGLWLSNYREGARKRMGFAMAYSIISHLLSN